MLLALDKFHTSIVKTSLIFLGSKRWEKAFIDELLLILYWSTRHMSWNLLIHQLEDNHETVFLVITTSFLKNYINKALSFRFGCFFSCHLEFTKDE